MNNVLKACPFCGKDKLSLESKSKNEYKGRNRTYYVRCNSCHARGGTVSGYVEKNYYCKEDVNIISDDELKLKAINKWNMRNK